MNLVWLVLLAAQSTVQVQASSAISARCAAFAESPSARVAPTPLIAPGPPPLLSFRYYEGRMHHRYGNLDLVLDDAGH
jgi:hypothetical protein